MDFARSKQFYRTGGVDVHSLVGDWWNDAEVPYVAHGISLNNRVVRLADVKRLPANDSPDKHPDQQYWKTDQKKGPPKSIKGIADALVEAAGPGGLARIEIDCKLMPCFLVAKYEKCMFQVPALLKKLYGLDNTTLWIFSHANEKMGSANSSSKRRIICNSGDDSTKLTAAYNAHDGWAWSQ